MDVVAARSIWVSGPDSVRVLSTPQARGDRPSGSSRLMARAWAACCTTNSSWPTRPVCFPGAAGLRIACLSPRLSYIQIILAPDNLQEQPKGAYGMQPRNAIVTGASHGIGAYIARALAGRGMNLLLVARSGDELLRLAKELRTRDVTVAVAAIDLAGRQAAGQVAEAAAAELGQVDVLVNNAAIEPQTRFHVLTPAEIEQVLQVDLISPLLLSRLLLPGMLERRYGRIINVSSLAGHTSFPYTEAYAAAKDGLTAFSRVLAGDYRGTGVAATSLILGPVKGAGVTVRTLAETGVTASTAFSVAPEKVTDAVLRSIRKPKAEMVVSVGPGRILKALMDYFPGLGPAVNRLSGADKLMSSVADYREATRAYPPRRDNSQPA